MLVVMLLLLDFVLASCHCNKTPEIITFPEGKVGFDSVSEESVYSCLALGFRYVYHQSIMMRVGDGGSLFIFWQPRSKGSKKRPGDTVSPSRSQPHDLTY